MRCGKVRRLLREPEALSVPPAALEHLGTCAECAAYSRDLRLLRAGFQALAEAQPPEPSFGFVARLLRRLEEAGEAQVEAGFEFLERAGKRVVLATALLTLLALLALVLPATGPLRDAGSADVDLPQGELTLAEADPIFAPDLFDRSGAVPAASPAEVQGREQ